MPIFIKMTAGALLCGLLWGCSDSRLPGDLEGSSARVLDLASSPDEVSEPLPVNDGAFVFDDTSESAEPLPVNR